MTYVGEKPEAREVLEQLEAIVREVVDDVASWRARALKAEAELKGLGGRNWAGAAGRPESERTRMADLESENRALRQRVEAARSRVDDLLRRLTFLEEQAREAGAGNGGARK